MRGLARLLVGPNATKDQVDSKRAQISKWRQGPKGISDRNAWAIAEALKYPLSHFVKDRALTMRDELLSEQERQAKELRAVQRELAALRKQQTQPATTRKRRTA